MAASAGDRDLTSSSDDDDSSTSDETDDNKLLTKTRQKREIVSCQGSSTLKTTQIFWPPPSSSVATSSWRNLRPSPRMRQGNPLLGNKMQLFSRTQYFIAVYPDGVVRGTRDPNDLHTHLEIIPAHHPGHVKIQGMLTKLYVAIDRKGRLYGEADSMAEETIFVEAFQGSYNTYLSLKYAHLGWYIGIKKSGKFKKGPKTKYGQKAIQFLPRRNKFE